MRLLVCASGTIGDVHPLVGIAARMQERGHEVILLANPAYESLAQEAGIEFEPVGTKEELDRIRQHPHAWSYAQGWKVWTLGAGAGPMRDLFAAIERRNDPGKTAIAASYLCFGARIARDQLQIPTATMHLNVHTIRSVYGVYAYPPPGFLPDILPRSYLLPGWCPVWYRKFTLWWVEKVFIDPPMRKQIWKFQRELGQQKFAGSVRAWWTSPDAAIGLHPSWWAGEHPDWPPHVATTGFPFWDRSESATLSDELREFLDDPKPLIVFTPGASASHTSEHFASFERSCTALGGKGIIITSQADGSNSSDIRYERYVPFGQLLPHVAAVVHHAGIGTSAHCLAAGIPQVVVPTLYNQPDTAIRLEKLGVARQVSFRRFSQRRLTAALTAVLQSAEIAARCNEYARLMAECDPMPDICARLEALLSRT